MFKMNEKYKNDQEMSDGVVKAIFHFLNWLPPSILAILIWLLFFGGIHKFSISHSAIGHFILIAAKIIPAAWIVIYLYLMTQPLIKELEVIASALFFYVALGVFWVVAFFISGMVS